jgi:hypothetical protein
VFNSCTVKENGMSGFDGAKLLLACLITLAATGLARGGATAPVSDSSPEALKAAEVFQSLYGDELKRVQATPVTTDDVALAAKLLEAARTAGVPVPLLTILCEKSAQLGLADPKGYETALAAAQLLASSVPEKAEAAQDTILTVRQRQYDQARPDEKIRLGQAYADQLLTVAAAKARAGDLDEAINLCGKASRTAKAVKSTNADEADALQKHYTDLKKVLGELPRLKTTLAAEPGNREVREQIIRLYLVELDNPAEAAKYLNDSCDAALRKFVLAAVLNVEAAPELAAMDLGDWYRGLADKATTPTGKRAMLVRSAAYYQRFLSLHPGNDLDRTKATLALKKAEEDIGKLGAAAPNAGGWTDLLKLVDLKRDAPEGNIAKGDDGLIFAVVTQTKLNLPVIPAGDYEIEVRFTRTSGDNSVCLMFPVGETSASVMLNGYTGRVSGLDMINGKSCDQNETTVKGAMVNGRAYTLNVRVSTAAEKATILATLDGKPFIKWSGPVAALSPSPYWKPLDAKSPTFGGWQVGITLHSARLKMLSGKMTFPPPPAAETTPTRPAVPTRRVPPRPPMPPVVAPTSPTPPM